MNGVLIICTSSLLVRKCHVDRITLASHSFCRQKVKCLMLVLITVIENITLLYIVKLQRMGSNLFLYKLEPHNQFVSGNCYFLNPGISTMKVGRKILFSNPYTVFFKIESCFKYVCTYIYKYLKHGFSLKICIKNMCERKRRI